MWNVDSCRKMDAS